MKAHRIPERRASRLARTLTPVMAAVLLSACGTLTPEYQRPQAPVRQAAALRLVAARQRRQRRAAQRRGM